MEINLDEDQENQLDNDMNPDEVKEQMHQRMLLEQQREFDAKMRLIRFKNRWNVDELI